METGSAIPDVYDCDLICTENREFLYDTDHGLLSIQGVCPDLVFPEQTQSRKKVQDVQQEATRVIPNVQTLKKARRRNSLKDKMRTEAEQNAYKKLKEIIPSLRESKRVTKLETIRQACLYIEKLQQTLTSIKR